MPTHNPRLNVTVTPEQHALLLELAELNGGSASGYLRQMLDQATPLLRATVPALRLAAEEMNNTKQETSEVLADLLRSIADAGVNLPQDLFDAGHSAAPSAVEPQRSEDARGKGGKS